MPTDKLVALLLGTLLIALSGRSTRTVRMADRLMFCRSSEYSTILGLEVGVGGAQRHRRGEKNTVKRLIFTFL